MCGGELEVRDPGASSMLEITSDQMTPFHCNSSSFISV